MATTDKSAPKDADKAAAEVQSQVDEDLARGYRGHVPDTNPNEAYSLLSGPDSPPLVEDNRSRFPQPGLPKKEG